MVQETQLKKITEMSPSEGFFFLFRKRFLLIASTSE